MATDADVDRLVRKMQEGKSPDKAFQPIFERYYPSVSHFFANRGCPEQDAEDLAQEALLRVYRSIRKFRLEASFDTWVFKIVRNLWKNEVRDRKAQKRAADEVSLEATALDPDNPEAVEEPRDSGPDPLDGALASERNEILQAALQELPPKMREVVLLRMQEFKYREIAVILKVSLTTVKSQLMNASRRLRPLLEPHFDVFFLDHW